MSERVVGSTGTVPPAAAAFPGATGVTVLDVYDWPAPDGLPGGSAHVHLASTEGYVVLAGAGRLQTLGERGYAETPLRPGECLWFTPGTIHRLVNDGGLRLLVVMQNAGLPEHGDAVLTFPPEVLADPAAYASAASLASGAGDPGSSPATDEALAAAARRRASLAVEGYLVLRERVTLATGFAMPKANLAVPLKMLQDLRLKLNHLARRANWVVQNQRTLPRQAGHTGSYRQMRSTIVAEGRFCVAARQSLVQVPPARAIADARPLTIR